MKIAVVAAVCVDRDAISAAAASQAELLATLSSVRSVDLFSEHVERPLNVPAHTVRDPWSLLRHPAFRNADVAIFHWGIHGRLFDAVTLLGEGGPTPVLMFHNMTPPELADEPRVRDVLEQSRIQLAHLVSLPVHLWTYSEENRRTLQALTGSDREVAFVPFPIAAPRPLVDRRSARPLRMLSVGRFSAAKGTDTLIEAFGRVVSDGGADVTLELVGSPTFSSARFMSGLYARLAELRLVEHVVMSTDVDDEQLWDRLERAHVVVTASRHEGLCVPVVEAYLAGCRVVATDGGNLRYLVQPPDPVVPAGDVDALADAMAQVIDEVRAGQPVDRQRAQAVADAYSHASAQAAVEAALGAIRSPRRVRRTEWPAVVTGGGPAASPS